jgi:hypothetical protein
MFKEIPDSDKAIRPFQVYRRWGFDETTITPTFIENKPLGNFDEENADVSNDRFSVPFWRSIKHQFFKDTTPEITDIPIQRFQTLINEKSIGDSGLVWDIPQNVYGEGLQKKSVRLQSQTEDLKLSDDGFSNLLPEDFSQLDIISVDFNDETFVFENFQGTFDTTIEFIDFEESQIRFTHVDETKTFELIQVDNQPSIIRIKETPIFIGGVDIISNPFGYVFYNIGLILLSSDSTTINFDTVLSDFDISFKSTKTIYEHEFFLSVEEDEFNVSQNPSAIELLPLRNEFGIIQEDETFPVIKSSFVSRVDPSVTGSFSDYDQRTILDPTGSFLAPFITTVGLYNDSYELLAVAKLTKPIKSFPDYPVNFIIRIDT